MPGMLRSLMTRRTGQAYPVNDQWRESVRAALERRDMSQADLARAAHCSAATISELLGGKSDESPMVPAIHAALGWSPPHGARLSDDKEELLAHWEKLDPAGKQRLLERAAALAEVSASSAQAEPAQPPEKPGKKRS